MGELFRLEVRSLNPKSLLILGLITNILARRINGCGEAGGGKGIRTHATEARFRPIEQLSCSELTGFRA
jgi:hypothetical protein